MGAYVVYWTRVGKLYFNDTSSETMKTIQNVPRGCQPNKRVSTNFDCHRGDGRLPRRETRVLFDGRKHDNGRKSTRSVSTLRITRARGPWDAPNGSRKNSALTKPKQQRHCWAAAVSIGGVLGELFRMRKFRCAHGVFEKHAGSGWEFCSFRDETIITR